jgi:tetratricopeptide (TPR) repeat protein
LLGSAALLIFGCATGRSAFERGNAFVEEGQWERAIEYYQRALREEPNNPDYQAALQAAKARAAKVYYNKAMKILESPDVTLESLQEALEEIQKATDLSPNDLLIRDAAGRVIQDKRAVEAMIDSHFRKGLEGGNNQKWEEAIKEFQAALKMNPSSARIRAKLDEAKDNLALSYFDKGLSLQKEGRWEEAIAEFDKSLAAKPDFAQALREKERSRVEFEVSEHLRAGEQYFAIKEWDKAIGELEAVLKLRGNFPEVEAKLKEAKMERIKPDYALGVDSENKRMWENAIFQYKKVMALLPDYEDVRIRLRRVTDRGADEHYQKGTAYEEAQKWGNAAVEYARSLDLVPGFRDAEDKIGLMKDNLEKTATFFIAIPAFQNSSNESGIGGALASELSRSIISRKPVGLGVVERESLEKVLKEQELSLGGFVDPLKVKELGKLVSADAVLLGNVVFFSIEDKDISKEYKSKDYKDPTRKVKNPQFESTKGASETVSRGLAGAFGLGGAIIGAAGQIAAGAAVPEYIPSDQVYGYAEGEAEREAFMQVNVNMIDTETGTYHTDFESKVDGRESRRDRYLQPTDAEDIPRAKLAGITLDPLNLPPADELKRRVFAKVVDKLTDKVIDFFKGRAQAYYDKGQSYLERKQREEAVEEFMKIIVLAPNSGLARDARERIKELKGFEVK